VSGSTKSAQGLHRRSDVNVQHHSRTNAIDPEADWRVRNALPKSCESILIWHALCATCLWSGLPAYVVMPSGRDVLEALLSAFATPPEKTVWTLIIGRRGPMAGPTACGGVLAPFVTCDQVYSFSLADLSDSLARALKPRIKAKQVTNEQLSAIGAELFERIASSIDNSGALDSHRALNYMPRPATRPLAAARRLHAIKTAQHDRLAHV
jgi:hypothetical protein